MMNKVNVAVECNLEHKASVYALITSIKINKNPKSRYSIYVLTNGTDKSEWTALQTLADKNTEIILYEGIYNTLDGVDKIIYLKWNTIVMGDLTSLYHMDMEGKSMAVAVKSRNFADGISGATDMYDMSVRLIDMTKTVSDEDYKEMSVYYNYGYDKSEGAFHKLKDWALILRVDEQKSPDEYFDGLMSELWSDYYRMSPIGNEPLFRESYTETIGKVTADIDNAIPVLIPVSDRDVTNVINLIGSIKERLQGGKQLDIRIVYKQLSVSNKEKIKALVSDDVSLVMYSVREYFENYVKASCELLMSAVFAEYEKAIFVKPYALCMEDITNFYNEDMEGFLVGIPKSIADESCNDVSHSVDLYMNTDIMLINIRKWNEEHIGSKIYEMLDESIYEEYTIDNLISMICRKYTKTIDGATWTIDEEALNSSREDDSVKEVLEKIQKLEEANAKLKARNKQLEGENEKLYEEKNQFLNEVLEIRKSITFRVGRLITYIPRKLLRRQ